MRRRERDREGFIFFLVGSRNMVSDDATVEPLQARCPRCGQETTLVGKRYRTYFTLFFVPLFPVGGAHRFSLCTSCQTHFPVPLDELRGRLSASEKQQSQQAIALYNGLRASPANSITLNELMVMYASMKEYAPAVSAANDFPQALNSSEQCMSTLGRVYLAMGQQAEAIRWFDAAVARNPLLGEAHYHKAVACLAMTPPDTGRAVTAARAARNAGYPRAEELLKDAEEKARG